MVLFLLLLSTCSSFSAAQDIPADTQITLERTGCEGVCAIYTLKIKADGTVVYRGKQFVRTRRTVVSKIDLDQLRILISEFEKVNYFSLRNRYQYVEDECPGAGLDYPSAITSIRINGRLKTISHDYGCSHFLPDGRWAVYPKQLFELEQKIDGIVGTKRWTQ